MSHTNQYGNFLDKIRTKNFINAIRPPNNQIMIQGPNSFVCMPPSNQQQSCLTNQQSCHSSQSSCYPTLNVDELTVQKINGVILPIGVVAQTHIHNKKIVLHSNQSLENDYTNLISGDNSFSIKSPSNTKRYIKINASIIIVDPTPNICGHVFFTITDTNNYTNNYTNNSSCSNSTYSNNNDTKYNVATEYCTSQSENFTKTICFEHYMTVLANTNMKIQLFATATSNTCFISKNIGMYNEEFKVGPSYFTITDLGGFSE